MDNFEAHRSQLWQDIDALLNLKKLSAVREASQLLREWIDKHPDDHYSRDGAEEVAMMEGALEILGAEKAAELTAV